MQSTAGRQGRQVLAAPIVAIVIVACVAGVAAADAQVVPGPKWVSGPDRAYNCTHYLDAPSGWKDPPRVKPGEPMKLVMRRGKVMKFTLSAKPTNKRGKVTYALLDAPPPGAKLDGAKFTWTVAGAAGQKFDFAVVAIGDDRGRSLWPISVTIADDKLVTAWSAGLGSVWPDCTVYAEPGYTVEDLDGDGKDDVIYRTYSGEDVTEAHVMLQHGKMKFVEVYSCMDCWPRKATAVDGTPLLIHEEDCCCVQTGTVLRIEGHTTKEVASWQEHDGCDRPRASIVFDTDKKQRIKAIEIHSSDGSVRRLKWQGDGFF